MSLVSSQFSRLRVLVADDDEFTLDFAGHILAILGVDDIRFVRDGISALEVCDDPSWVPDVIFCDIDMEPMDGIEVLRHLDDRAYVGSMVLMSGTDAQLIASVGRLLSTYRLDFRGFIDKPLERDRVANILEAVVGTDAPEAVTEPVLDAHISRDGLQRGLREGRVELYAQPKVRLDTEAVVGAELLLRWRNDDGSFISPLVIIPAAEDAGLMDEVTTAVFRRACEHVRNWQSEGLVLDVSVNVSTSNLRNLRLPDLLDAVTRDGGVDSHHFVLEVTESRLIEDLNKSLDVVGRLYLKGFRFSIDDFGTGYSNFSTLMQLPLSEIKIDRSLVQSAPQGKIPRAVLASSASVAKSLGVHVTAEGVENATEWELVKELGCDIVQGYYVSAPMAAEKLPDWVAKWDLVTRVR